MDGQVQMSELVGSWTTDELESDLRPLSAIMLIKSAAADGEAAWSARSGGADLSSEELLGALSGFVESLKNDLATDWDQSYRS